MAKEKNCWRHLLTQTTLKSLDMSKIILTIGLPASGKTTWALEQAKADPKGCVIVCRDDLRNSHGGFHKDREGIITGFQRAMAESAIEAGKNVIVADTNLNPKTRNLWKAFSLAHDISYEEKAFTDVPLEVCIKRDAKRAAPVGEKVIRDFYNKYLRPEPIKQDPDLPKAIIVDIDGTLADHEGLRSPYDWAKVGVDRVKAHVAEIVRRFKNTHVVIVFSGRDEVCRKETMEWLYFQNIPYTGLYMRPEKNMEKDSIIKRRLFDEHVKGNYYVDFVLDDRLQVCRMWHEMGLNLLRVGDPDANF